MANTKHGHHIPGTPPSEYKGEPVARCGGPGFCTECAFDCSNYWSRAETLAELKEKGLVFEENVYAAGMNPVPQKSPEGEDSKSGVFYTAPDAEVVPVEPKLLREYDHPITIWGRQYDTINIGRMNTKVYDDHTMIVTVKLEPEWHYLELDADFALTYYPRPGFPTKDNDHIVLGED